MPYCIKQNMTVDINTICTQLQTANTSKEWYSCTPSMHRTTFRYMKAAFYQSQLIVNHMVRKEQMG